jgi:large subunit ribosomal protein L25
MTLKLDAKIRTLTGKKSEELRQMGKIPAVTYGHGVENTNLELDYNAFDKAYSEAGESAIIELNVDGKTYNVIVSDVQLNSVSGQYAHVDFHQIKMDEKITAPAELKLVGEPKAVKELGGVLIHNISEVEIKCLPGDLISEIEVDVSGLEKFSDAIVIADLKLSDKLEIIGHEDTDVVATVSEPREEAEEEVVETATEETEGGEKTEGEDDKKADASADAGETKDSDKK